ncbi:MAG: hypothetical protein KDD60_06495, partial [Bdellovibrionales bacterium]|nr:hypothetical protein [Bdellovibrionales bacterium]
MTTFQRYWITTLLVLTSSYASIALGDTLLATGSSILLIDASTNESQTFIASAGGGMFYEEDSEKLYFTGSSNSIQRSDRDGSNITTIIANVGGAIGDLVVDTENSRIIWTQPQDSVIRSSDLDGGNISVLVNGASFAQGLAIDQTNGKLYWTGPGSIESSNLDGSSQSEVLWDDDNFGTYFNLVLNE